MWRAHSWWDGKLSVVTGWGECCYAGVGPGKKQMSGDWVGEHQHADAYPGQPPATEGQQARTRVTDGMTKREDREVGISGAGRKWLIAGVSADDRNPRVSGSWESGPQSAGDGRPAGCARACAPLPPGRKGLLGWDCQCLDS